MDGGRTTKRQTFFTQREPEYDQDTDLHQRESMRKEEKKYLNKQCNPMYLQGVRTIMKSDSAGPQGFGQPWPHGPDVSKPQRHGRPRGKWSVFLLWILWTW